MKKEKIVVVDYGLGNLYSVERALVRCGVKDVCISSTIDDVITADKLILPGVGAFQDGIRNINQLCLSEPIKQHATKNKPLLGICLGMQLLATKSHEFGEHIGLNIIPGNVLPIQKKSKVFIQRKVPCIGWADLVIDPDIVRVDPVLNTFYNNKSVYLVHSFYFHPVDKAHVIATYESHGDQITAAVKSGNSYGFQFHPEKSGAIGLDILKNFCEI